MARPRTNARLAAVQALFQSEQEPRPYEAVIDEFRRYRLGAAAAEEGFAEGRVPPAHMALFAEIVTTACQEQERFDALLTQALPADWPLARLDAVLRALLRAAAAELSCRDGPPVRVVINEYLDVAHAFFHDEEPRLVNGVLDRLARTLRPGECAPKAAPAP